MGDQGPCGPCSEVHHDRIGGGRDAAKLVNADDPDVIEIWNIVFMHYNRDPVKGLSKLPSHYIDTGMGLERLASILQNKPSNYDIDDFQTIITAIGELTGPNIGPYKGKLGTDDVTLQDTAYRAIADHIRCLTFALADGMVPSNEGRGYALRRILRRGARYAQQILQADSGMLTSLVSTVVPTYEDAHPELRIKYDDIVKDEEESFSSMLDRGIQYFETNFVKANNNQDSKTVSGEEAFYLYDTLGFPIDLTSLMAEEAGLTLDTKGFEEAMETQRIRSRAARNAARNNGNGARLELIAEQTAFLSNEGVAVTDDAAKYIAITNNDQGDKVVIESEVVAIYTNDAGFVEEHSDDVTQIGILLKNTPFYAEAGGQETDLGTLTVVDGAIFKVTDVQTYGGYILHSGVLVGEAAKIAVGDMVKCQVDYDRRGKIAPNHTMTHVLNAALLP